MWYYIIIILHLILFLKIHIFDKRLQLIDTFDIHFGYFRIVLKVFLYTNAHLV